MMLKLRKLEESLNRNQSLESILNQKYNNTKTGAQGTGGAGHASQLSRSPSKKRSLITKVKNQDGMITLHQGPDLPPIFSDMTNMRRLNHTENEVNQFKKALARKRQGHRNQDLQIPRMMAEVDDWFAAGGPGASDLLQLDRIIER